MDFEVERRQEEVQKERKRAAEWTLRWRGGRRKSKRSEKCGGLDFEAEGRQEKVQKEREGAEDWTLKQRGDRRKSKRSEKERRIGR